MLIGSKNLEIYSNVVPTVHNFVLLPPTEPILGNDNTSPICSPNGVWAPKPPLPHGLPMQNSLYPVMNGTFGNVRRQFPIWSTTNSGPTLNLRDANKMCCSFVPSVQDFMPFECPVRVRRANNGSAEFPKMKIQGLYVVLVNGTVPACKRCNRWNNCIKIAETLRNGNPPVFQNPFVGMIRLRRLLQMVLQVQKLLLRSVRT